MEHLTTDALIRKLQSSIMKERSFAAEELGARRSQEAVAPLCRALTKVPNGHCEEVSTVNPIIEALAAIGDPAAIGPILYALEVTAGVLFMPIVLLTPCEVACRALVQLGATSALPAMEKLLRGRHAELFGAPLALAMVELGGSAMAPLFEELLASSPVQAASAVALARLGHRGALPGLRLLRDAPDVHRRTAALCALVALREPGAEAELEAEMFHTPELQPKHNLLVMFRDAGLTSHADWLFQRCFAPAWANPRRMLFDTLSTAVELGSAAALAHVRSLHQDPSLSLCDRASAAANLIDRNELDALGSCLHFLQQRSEDQEPDPRDPPARWAETQRNVFDSVRMFGMRHRRHRLAIVDALTPLLVRGPSEDFDFDTLFCPYECAGEVVYSLSGTYDMKSLTRWRQAHAARAALVDAGVKVSPAPPAS